MWILALDTSTRGGSAAVARDDNVIAFLQGESGADTWRTSAQRPHRAGGHRGRCPDRHRLLCRRGRSPDRSTGLRVGIATMQALATGGRASRRAVVDARCPRPNWCWRRFAGRHGCRAGRSPGWMASVRRSSAASMAADGQTALDEPRVGPAAVVLDGWASLLADVPITVIGDGIEGTRDLLDAKLGSRLTLCDPPPLAPVMVRLAAEAVHRAVEPHAVQPLYVRRPDAVRARERGHQPTAS